MSTVDTSRSRHDCGMMNKRLPNRPVVINYASMFVGFSMAYVPAAAFGVLSFDWSFSMFGAYDFRPWRLLIILNILPGLIAAFALLALPESPKFLLSVGRWTDVVRGCPQGSVCGPFIWNFMMDPLLRRHGLSWKCCAYADDLLVLVEGRSRAAIESLGESAMSVVCGPSCGHLQMQEGITIAAA